MNNPRLVHFLERLEKIMYASARHIVTVGEGYRQRLIEKGVPGERISVVMNGINRNLFSLRRPDDDLKRQYGVSGKFICSYSGTIGMACGLGVVLDAAQMLKDRNVHDIVFMLIGEGASRKDLECQARERLLGNVVFTGRLPKEKMPDFLAVTDVCLVHLRKTDLFTTVMPSKIFEAAGMAKPIINGVGGFAAEFIQKDGAGINIEPENGNQLVDALLLLRQNPVLCATFGNVGHEYVAANYDRDKLAQEYLDVIVRIIA